MAVRFRGVSQLFPYPATPEYEFEHYNIVLGQILWCMTNVFQIMPRMFLLYNSKRVVRQKDTEPGRNNIKQERQGEKKHEKAVRYFNDDRKSRSENELCQIATTLFSLTKIRYRRDEDRWRFRGIDTSRRYNEIEGE